MNCNEIQTVCGDGLEDGVEYRLIDGFPAYAVGNDGSIWSRFISGHGMVGNVWKNRKFRITPDGYSRIGLKNGDIRVERGVHRLVLQAFVGHCPPGQECRHLNGIKSDNRLENLAWGTKLENQNDKRLHGTIAMGESHGMAILDESHIREIRRLRSTGMTFQSIGLRFGISKQHTIRIVKGKSWKCVA